MATLWLIDDSEEEASLYSRRLEALLDGSVKVVGLRPLDTVVEYIELLDTPDTVGLVIDQRLYDAGMTKGTGMDIALNLRAMERRLPVYILTNWAEDIGDYYPDEEWSVEAIIDKDLLGTRDPERLKLLTIVIARMRRVLGIQNLLKGSAERYNTLLKKSLVSQLGEGELDELQRLREERLMPIAAEEAGQLDTISSELNVLRDLLAEIEEANSRGDQQHND